MRPKLATNKCITKNCPKCQKQMPTACKKCPCGHQFRRVQSPVPPSPTENTDNRRRTERVRRQKPHYYNAIEYEHSFKRKKKKTLQHKSGEDGEKKKKAKAKSVKNEDGTASPADSSSSSRQAREDDPFANLQPEKAMQLAIVLNELNRKYSSQNFKPS